MARMVWDFKVGHPMTLDSSGIVTISLQHKSGRVARLLFDSAERFELKPPPPRYFAKPPSRAG